MPASPAQPPVISVSRRTDIPAFYPRWFAARLEAGFALVPNPFNPAQVSRVDLRPEAARVFVFWTRNPLPLLPYLKRIWERGQDFYFQLTLVDYPRELEAFAPRPPRSVAAMLRLAEAVGPRRIVWRYDPIYLSPVTDAAYHLERFERLARSLTGACDTLVVSQAQLYRKNARRLAALSGHGLAPVAPSQAQRSLLLGGIAGMAKAYGFAPTICAPDFAPEPYGLTRAACVDPDRLRRVFGLETDAAKDPGQRANCACVKSADIGMYDACLFGCAYCYATKDQATARAARARHDPSQPWLLPGKA